MHEVKALQISVIKYSAILVALGSAALMIGLRGAGIPFALGLFLGAAISNLTFMLLANSLVRSTFMEPSKAQLYMGSQYFVRFSIIAVVLFISAKVPYLNIFATAVGVLLVKAILYVIQLSDNRKMVKNLERKEE